MKEGKQMEIKLDALNANAYVAMMRTKAGELSLTGTSTELEGQSEALEKFLSIYQDFFDTLSAYQTLLNNDIQSVSNAMNTLEQADRKESERVDSLGFILKPAQTP